MVYAEDDMVFREIAVPAITKVGIKEESILTAEHGLEALNFLEGLQDGNPDDAIVMLLDVNMPVMDGNTCAKKVRALEAEGKLRRLPFLVCCSSGVEQVTFGAPGDIYDITMPKPFSDKEVDLVLKKAKEWWNELSGSGGGAFRGGAGSSSAGGAGASAGNTAATGGMSAGGGGGGGRGGTFDISEIDMIVGDPEPICRMALTTALTLLGCNEDLMVECDTVEEVADALRDAQQKKEHPVMIFLSNTGWADIVTSECGSLSRKPFVVCTSVDGDQGVAGFNACLPKQFQQADLQKIVEECRRWWMGQ
eukprot:CAMPEP_0176292836 /NCGR_PEP_ID=MMETSP0121_2-20121125/56288_1 /TAXON_ID=160619 /ORGANISM="Kryptoperidinium foliaceum, Strain CCMP 1326" /LENGTH=306 /DNA_ID=CAMNT_0017633759 /DNA_START=120 /DNA_END=1040 /DNA_ORIENTATION=-